jgi:hypothetical protein
MRRIASEAVAKKYPRLFMENSKDNASFFLEKVICGTFDEFPPPFIRANVN